MASVTYKSSHSIRLKAVGTVNMEQETIMTDDGEYTFTQLFRDFDGQDVDVSIGMKTDNDLSIPKEVD